jgi:hypothetical protein
MSQRNNPYDLSSKNGTPKEHKSTTYTVEEQAEKLKNYIVILPDLYALVRYGTHVRYVTTKGDFRIGGFVKHNPFETVPKGATEKKTFIKLQNGFNVKSNGYVEWLVAYEDIATLYVKPDAIALTMQRDIESALTSLNSNVTTLAHRLKKITSK